MVIHAYKDVDTWRRAAEGSSAERTAMDMSPSVPHNVDEALVAARASQRQAAPMARRVADADRGASLRCLTSATAADVDTWLAAMKERRNEVGRRACNDMQFAPVELVARRVKQELIASAHPSADFGEPRQSSGAPEG